MTLLVATIISLIWIFIIALPRYVNDKNASFYVNKYIFPFHSALVLGGFMGAGVYAGSEKTAWGTVNINMKCTLFNIGEWYKEAGMWLIFFGVSLLFIAFVQLIWCRDIKAFVRDCITMAAVLIASYGVWTFLEFIESSYGILALLALPIYLVFGIANITIFPSALLWLLPTSTIAAMNRSSEARERAAIGRKPNLSSEDEDIFGETELVPTYVTDDDGNQYPVEMRGDYIVVRGPHGETSTRWEYVKGQAYFDLDGTRFFLH